MYREQKHSICEWKVDISTRVVRFAYGDRARYKLYDEVLHSIAYLLVYQNPFTALYCGLKWDNSMIITDYLEGNLLVKVGWVTIRLADSSQSNAISELLFESTSLYKRLEKKIFS